LKSRVGGIRASRVIDLPEGTGLLPLSEALLREIQEAGRGAEGSASTGGVFEFLTPAVDRWVRTISRGATIAYVETEYFGGEGYERAAVFRDGDLVLGPLDGAGAINQALRALGVVSRSGQEPFDALGLGRHRSLEEWLSEA
jgi:hypothetical protein